ncbi:MAG: hypothetical protein J6X70_10775 [Muribaculaceae bacterium]|nr:hypothetical protein [Muribaculaceae bacterium]
MKKILFLLIAAIVCGTAVAKPPLFETIEPIGETGYSEVTLKGRVGVFTTEGWDEVVPIAYEAVLHVHDNPTWFLLLKTDGRYTVFYPDTQKEVGDFAHALLLDHHMLIVTNDADPVEAKWALFSLLDREVVSEPVFTHDAALHEWASHLIIDGKILWPKTPMLNGKMLVWFENDSQLKVMDRRGKVVGKITEYGNIDTLEPIPGADRDDYRFVVINDGLQNGQLSLADLNFKLVAPFGYDNITAFVIDKELSPKPVAVALQGDKMLVIDVDGKVLRTLGPNDVPPLSLAAAPWHYDANPECDDDEIHIP